MTPAEQIQLCRAILLEVQTGLGQPGGPIGIDGFESTDVNEAVRVMVQEGLVVALPPGTRYPAAWAASSITYAGIEFLEAYRTEQCAAEALRRVARARSRSETIAEFVSILARAVYFAGP